MLEVSILCVLYAFRYSVPEEAFSLQIGPELCESPSFTMPYTFSLANSIDNNWAQISNISMISNK